MRHCESARSIEYAAALWNVLVAARAIQPQTISLQFLQSQSHPMIVPAEYLIRVPQISNFESRPAPIPPSRAIDCPNGSSPLANPPAAIPAALSSRNCLRVPAPCHRRDVVNILLSDKGPDSSRLRARTRGTRIKRSTRRSPSIS